MPTPFLSKNSRCVTATIPKVRVLVSMGAVSSATPTDLISLYYVPFKTQLVISVLITLEEDVSAFFDILAFFLS